MTTLKDFNVSDIILHHYPSSPFSEKIRLVLGYKKLAWKSVIIPSIMPKPDVLALTGGYRKTPFMQVPKAWPASPRSGPTALCFGLPWPTT